MTNRDKIRDAKYSTKERNCTTTPAPPARLLDVGDLFSRPNDNNDKPNLEKLKQHLLLEGRLTEEAALRIIQTGNFLSRFIGKTWFVVFFFFQVQLFFVQNRHY